MHKELIICIIVIIIVIIANTITQRYAQEAVETMDEKLDILEKSLEKEEGAKEEIQANLDNVMQNWREKYEKLAFFIEHDELEKVETELTELKGHIKVEQYEEAINPIETSIFILNHIKEKFRLNMKNIF